MVPPLASEATSWIVPMAAIPCKGVIMVGGSTTDSWFRPLSMTLPKPLFPIAGRPLIEHHLHALARLGEALQEVLIVGFYDPIHFENYISSVSEKFPFIIRYLQEPKSLGTGGGLYHFKSEILQGNPKTLFIVYGDICGSFPFDRMLQIHRRFPDTLATILATHVPKEQTSNYGCLVKESPESIKIQHYVEKPETFVSDLISCGVYLLEASVLEDLGSLPGFSQSLQRPVETPSTNSPLINGGLPRPKIVRLEQDILSPLASMHLVAACETQDFWCQVKTPNSAITANRLYLEDALFKNSNSLLTRSSPDDTFEVVGAVWIDPTARVGHGAKIGPNVAVGPNCVIGDGIRIRDSIVLENTTIFPNAAVINSIVGWSSQVGAWSRIEGAPDGSSPCDTMVTLNGIKMPSITVLGGCVEVSNEAVVRNCIVLPNKELHKSYHNEILL